jgi:hypothetical protein
VVVDMQQLRDALAAAEAHRWREMRTKLVRAVLLFV